MPGVYAQIVHHPPNKRRDIQPLVRCKRFLREITRFFFSLCYILIPDALAMLKFVKRIFKFSFFSSFVCIVWKRIALTAYLSCWWRVFNHHRTSVTTTPCYELEMGGAPAAVASRALTPPPPSLPLPPPPLWLEVTFQTLLLCHH